MSVYWSVGWLVSSVGRSIIISWKGGKLVPYTFIGVLVGSSYILCINRYIIYFHQVHDVHQVRRCAAATAYVAKTGSRASSDYAGEGKGE